MLNRPHISTGGVSVIKISTVDLESSAEQTVNVRVNDIGRLPSMDQSGDTCSRDGSF